ncbi:hypothetical protein BH10BDE1_BH10BDE1_34500 [soil metagenome]
MKKPKLLYFSCGLNGRIGFDGIGRELFEEIRIVTLAPEYCAGKDISGLHLFEDVNGSNVSIFRLKSYSIDAEELAALLNFGADLLLVNGWSRLIPAALFLQARLGAFGAHAGHPPRGRGRAPVPWNIIKGFRELEVFLFKLHSDADSGPIADIETLEIGILDNAFDLYCKAGRACEQIYRRSIAGILSSTITLTPQVEALASHYPKRTPSDGFIDWRSSTEEIYNFVRALSYPYPGAFTFLNGDKVVIQSGKSYDVFYRPDHRMSPGTIIDLLPNGMVVRTGTSSLLIDNAQIGGETLDFKKEWAKYKQTMRGQIFSES